MGLILKNIKPLSIILIFCLGLLAYSNTFHCSFHFDDSIYIFDNFSIRDIHHLYNIWNFCPTRFITFFSIALNYHFNRMDVFGYHLVNLAVHLVCSFFVWWLVLLTFATPAMKEIIGGQDRDKSARIVQLLALLAGLVFVSHPIQTEAVTYIWQRTTSMAALFYLASLCFYVRSRLFSIEGNQAIRVYTNYISSLIFAVAAMFTKENTITLPLMIALYEFSFLKTDRSFNWKGWFPFLLILIIIPATLVVTRSFNFHEMHRTVEGPIRNAPLPYLFTEFRVMATYIRLLFFPVNQNLDYEYHISKNFFDCPVLISFLLLGIIFFAARRLFSKYRLVSFSIFWFFLTLLPESSFMPFNDVIFEHRLYLPMAGYSMFLVTGMYYLLGKNINKTMGIVSVIIILNSILTFQRNKIWLDDLTLYSDTVRKSPHKARPFVCRGNAYYDKGHLTKAMADFNKAIDLEPEDFQAYLNRGLAYEAQGDLSQALADYSKAVKINPKFAWGFNDRGFINYSQNNLAQAIADYNTAIELYPFFAQAYYNMGLVFDGLGNMYYAVINYTKAIESNPDYADAYNNRGVVYYRMGNLKEAISDYSRCIELNPNDAQAYLNRGLALRDRKLLPQAVSDFTRAIELNPELAWAYNDRGVALLDLKDYPLAIRDETRAIELNPQLAQSYYNRALALFAEKEYNRAWKDVQEAAKLKFAVNPRFLSSLKEAMESHAGNSHK